MEIKVEVLIPLYYNPDDANPDDRKKIEGEKYSQTFEDIAAKFPDYSVDNSPLLGDRETAALVATFFLQRNRFDLPQTTTEEKKAIYLVLTAVMNAQMGYGELEDFVSKRVTEFTGSH